MSLWKTKATWIAALEQAADRAAGHDDEELFDDICLVADGIRKDKEVIINKEESDD